MNGYYKLRKRALEILNSELPKGLYYHSLTHTLDVLNTSNNYIKRENITKEDAKLLRIAVFFHDTGFTKKYVDHEEVSRNIAISLMEEFGFSEQDICKVKGLIMATRIPQLPASHLEKIICDSDLDYLGRSDFYPISDQLFKELQFRSMIDSKLEWDKVQIKFLERHTYHTQFAIKNRQPNKEKRIKELKNSVLKAEKQDNIPQ